MTSNASTPASSISYLLNLGPNPSTDEIDDAIHGLIDDYFAGHLTEEATRREISSALYASRIHEQEANRCTDLAPQARNDLAEMLSEMLQKNVLSTEGKNSDLNFLKARNASVCGWYRQMAKAFIPAEQRKMRRSGTRNGTPFDPAGHEFSAMAQASPSLIVFDSHSAHVDGEVGDLVEQFTEITKGMRDTDRMVINAETICLGFGVNPAVRPELMTDRDYILKTIEKDPMAAHRSLRAFMEVVCGTASSSQFIDIDDRLMALWDEQTEDSASEILSRGPAVAHTLALAAVSSLPRPAKKALLKFKTVVKACSPRDAKWNELASAMVDAFVASEFEPVSQYATMSVDAKRSATLGHKISRERLSDLLVRAANHPNAPMGRSASQVLARLSSTAEAVFVDEPSKAQTMSRAMAARTMSA